MVLGPFELRAEKSKIHIGTKKTKKPQSGPACAPARQRDEGKFYQKIVAHGALTRFSCCTIFLG